MHFGIGKSRDVLCLACRTAWCNALVTAPSSRRVFWGVAKTWTGVDMSTSLFPEVVPEIYPNPEHKRLNFCMRALLFLRRPPY